MIFKAGDDAHISCARFSGGTYKEDTTPYEAALSISRGAIKTNKKDEESLKLLQEVEKIKEENDEKYFKIFDFRETSYEDLEQPRAWFKVEGQT